MTTKFNPHKEHYLTGGDSRIAYFQNGRFFDIQGREVTNKGELVDPSDSYDYRPEYDHIHSIPIHNTHGFTRIKPGGIPGYELMKFHDKSDFIKPPRTKRLHKIINPVLRVVGSLVRIIKELI